MHDTQWPPHSVVTQPMERIMFILDLHVNMPTTDREYNDRPILDLRSISDVVKAATVQHKDWTSLVLVITRKVER